MGEHLDTLWKDILTCSESDVELNALALACDLQETCWCSAIICGKQQLRIGAGIQAELLAVVRSSEVDPKLFFTVEMRDTAENLTRYSIRPVPDFILQMRVMADSLRGKSSFERVHKSCFQPEGRGVSDLGGS